MSYQAYNMPPPMPVDPTNVTGKRIAAWLVDGVIFVVIYNVLGALFGVSDKVTQRDFGDNEVNAKAFCDAWNATHDGFCIHSNGQVTAIASWQGGVWIFLALFVVYIVVQGLLGASLGKLALGLRIVKADGSLAGIGPSAIRTVLWIVDAITCALPIVGGILIFATKGHRRVGDMAAGTFVVPHHQVGHPVILPGEAGWGTYQAGPYPPPGGFGQQGGYGHPGGYGQTGAFGQPPSPPSPGGFGPPNDPTGGAPTPWAPPAGSTDIAGAGSSGSPAAGTGGAGDYEADVPIWDDARNAYIQYDSDRSAWLEYDDTAKEWKPIST